MTPGSDSRGLVWLMKAKLLSKIYAILGVQRTRSSAVESARPKSKRCSKAASMLLALALSCSLISVRMLTSISPLPAGSCWAMHPRLTLTKIPLSQ